jgi:hypothetical protein
MAIREFSLERSSKGSSRRTVGFLGQKPSGSGLEVFKLREFEVRETTVDEMRHSETIAQLGAVILTQPDKLSELRQIIDIVPHLLDNDVRVYIRLAEPEKRRAIARLLVVNSLREKGIPTANLYPAEWRELPPHLQEREGSRFMPSVYISDAEDSWVKIATIVCDHPAGPSPKLKLDFDPKSLDDGFRDADRHAERVLLLQRAFHDCSDLRLSFLPGGLSGASVCKAYACPEAGLVEAYPHLYFIKIGPRKKIIEEHDKYGGYLLEYVPFHLGPRLRPERCNLGSTQGILVGDFVEDTESLVACARGGRCGHAISNLFDRTLAGWRKKPHPDPNQTLATHLAKKWQIEGSAASIVLPDSRVKLVKQLGGLTDILPLKQIFEQYAATTPLCAPAHGDLHAANVLVRHGDAIIIDFEKIEPHYPLTYDPASLEGGILVEGFVEDLKEQEKKISPKELVDLLKPLYTMNALIKRREASCVRGSAAEWYYDSVNQIRMRSWPDEQPGQYALTLALCLIRKGCNTYDGISKEQDILRAIAFFFGQSILYDIDSDPTLTGGRARRK